jgi:hypothetical protein
MEICMRMKREGDTFLEVRGSYSIVPDQSTAHVMAFVQLADGQLLSHDSERKQASCVMRLAGSSECSQKNRRLNVTIIHSNDCGWSLKRVHEIATNR